MDIRAQANSLNLTGKARKRFMKKEKKKKKKQQMEMKKVEMKKVETVHPHAQQAWAFERSLLPMFAGDGHLYPDLFTIVLLADMTQSMQTAAEAILKAFPWVYGLVSLLGVDVRVAVYHDYDQGGNGASPRPRQGGWAITPPDLAFHPMMQWCHRHLRPAGGASHPEAGKTALMEMITSIKGQFLAINLTDAAVHGYSALNLQRNSEADKEKRHFREKQWPWDWKEITTILQNRQSQVMTYCPAPFRSQA